ncbi:retrovirus-related pol polyprotein from transposon TNT 1-94 [Tanacetum coccineum]
MKIEESLNVTFDETPPPYKTSPLVDDDLDEKEAIKVTKKKNLDNDIEDETLEVDEIVNIKESKNNPLDNVIENLNQRTLRLKSFLIKHEYNMGMVDNTLLTKKKSSNLIIVRIYVDDIIFDSTCQEMCDDFAKIMHDEFKMSMMGELNFFLGLQIKQIEDGIFFNQSKYIKEILKKFGLEESKPMKTPMSSDMKLTKDKECELVDSTKYRGMIGSLLYLMASRPDIMFSVCLCARFQEDPKTSHLEAVKRIFRYIKGTTHLGLWRQPKVNLPYGMLLTRLFNHIMSNFPELSNDRYILYDRVMYPLAPHYERKTRADHGTKRCRHSTSTSSSSAINHPSSSHHIDDDNDVNDEGTSRTSVSSPTRVVNSLFTNPPHDNQNMQTLHTHQTQILILQVNYKMSTEAGLGQSEKSSRTCLRVDGSEQFGKLLNTLLLLLLLAFVYHVDVDLLLLTLY